MSAIPSLQIRNSKMHLILSIYLHNDIGGLMSLLSRIG